MSSFDNLINFSMSKISFESYLYMGLLLSLTALALTGIYYIITIGNKHIEVDKRISVNLHLIGRLCLYTIAAVCIYLVFAKFDSLRHLLNSFITSLVIAYVLNPAVVRLEKKKYMTRKRAIFLIYLIVILVIVFLLASLLPRTISEFKKLFNNFPRYFKQVVSSLSELSVKYLGKDVFNLNNLKDYDVASLVKGMNLHFGESFSDMVNSVKSISNRIVMMVLIPIFVFYLLDDKEIFIAQVKKWLPYKYKDKILSVGRAMDKEVLQYVKGKIIMAIYVGLITGVSFSIIGIDLALVIGIITCIADIIPYIGPIIGFTPAFIFAFIDKPIKALWVVLLYPLLQWTENNLIGPKIMSDKLGMHGMLVLVATLAGGYLFGFIGMIFALPVVIAIRVIYGELKNK